MPKAGVEASLTSVCAWRAARYRKPSAVWDRTLPIMAHIVLLMTSCQIILNLRWLQTGQGDLWKYQIPCHHICRSILRGNAASTWKKQRHSSNVSVTKLGGNATKPSALPTHREGMNFGTTVRSRER